MSFWNILSVAAWGISVLLILWIIADAFRVGREYGEDFLLSSRESEE
jgi:hypothetical protein